MSGTRRTPIARATRTQIPAKAIAIYERMRKLKCTCGPYPDPTKWWGRQQCRGCRAWWDLHNELAHLVPHRAWEWPLVASIERYPRLRLRSADVHQRTQTTAGQRAHARVGGNATAGCAGAEGEGTSATGCRQLDRASHSLITRRDKRRPPRRIRGSNEAT
jgi:hypothetical protein